MYEKLLHDLRAHWKQIRNRSEVDETNVLNFKLHFNELLFKHTVHVRNIFKYSIVFHPRNQTFVYFYFTYILFRSYYFSSYFQWVQK